MNGIIIIDKPQDWTSHDVVGKLRGLIHERRIGHGGTLDPMATGVLPVFIGRATRAVQFCESADKEYIAGLKLGIVTDTQDITGNIIDTSDKKISRQELEPILSEFTGEKCQIPPMYSAVKVGGKKLYELARRGVEIERSPRKIDIKLLELIEETDGCFLLRVICSKGTYIRTLCHDIGQRLGCGGVMCSLKRVRAGAFLIDEAVTLETVENAVKAGAIEALVRPVDSLFTIFPAVEIDDEREAKCRNGAAFEMSGVPDGRYRVYNEKKDFLMFGEAENGIMKTVKSFFEVN